MSAKPSKPRAARRSKTDPVAEDAAPVEVVAAEAVPWVKPVRVLPELAARLARHWHFGWLTALLPRLSVDEARAALRATGPGAVLPAELMAAVRSRAVALPSRPAADLAEAEALAMMGDLPGSVRLAQRVVRMRAEDPAALMQLARLLRRAGMAEQARAALQAAVLRDTQGDLLTAWLGAAEVAVEAVPEVVAEAVEAAEVVPEAAAEAVPAAPVRRRKAKS